MGIPDWLAAIQPNHKENQMNRFSMMITGASLYWAFGTLAMGAEMSKAEYASEVKAIVARTRQAQVDCRALQEKARGMCLLEAQGRERIQRAELEERLAPSDEHRFQVEMAKIEARHALERERCADLSGPARMACVEKARDEFMMSKADALISHHKTSAGSQLIGPNLPAGQPGMEGQEEQRVRCHRMPAHERNECMRAGMGHHGQP